jgi:hypothetical protein
MDDFGTALVLTRVLTSGVLMSIEKNDRELPALGRLLRKATGHAHVSLVNSCSAGIHTSLVGQGIGYGDTIDQPDLSARQRAYVEWLGVAVRPGAGQGGRAFGFLAVGPDDVGTLRDRVGSMPHAPALVLDLTGLGFGPAAAVLTDDERAWARGERLKIFGSFDLRTMWTQDEADPELVPGVQFNYRLSPLVAACLRIALSPSTSRTNAPGAVS